MRISVTHFKKLGRPEAAKKMDYNKRNETKQKNTHKRRRKREKEKRMRNRDIGNE